MYPPTDKMAPPSSSVSFWFFGRKETCHLTPFVITAGHLCLPLGGAAARPLLGRNVPTVVSVILQRQQGILRSIIIILAQASKQQLHVKMTTGDGRTDERWEWPIERATMTMTNDAPVLVAVPSQCGFSSPVPVL
jgi:hypothetical protein